MGGVPKTLEEVRDLLLSGVFERDEETYWHCMRVGFYCKTLAELAGMNVTDRIIAEFAGIFHDIGKAAIPSEIVNKPGPLNTEEFEWIKRHPEISAETLAPYSHLPLFDKLIPGVRHHHERIDGKGYPDNLKGEEIPYISRIILIVDTFDAITQDRPYRKGRPIEVVFSEVERCAGTQFDKTLATTFLKEKGLWREELAKTKATLVAERVSDPNASGDIYRSEAA